jgi:hypothetical protein
MGFGDTSYKAVVAVGLKRIDMAEVHIGKLMEKFELEKLSSTPHNSYLDDVIGLRYEETEGFDSVGLLWDESEILRLKNKFLMLTGLEANVYLCTYGY